MPNIEAIEEEIQAILSVDENDLTEEEKKKFHDYIDELCKLESDKIDKLGFFFRHLDARIEHLTLLINELSSKKKTLENKKNSLRSFYTGVLINNNIKKIQGNVFSASLRKNIVVDIFEVTDKLPDEYKTINIDIKPNRIKIKKDLLEGKEVNGCKLVDKPTLMIR